MQGLLKLFLLLTILGFYTPPTQAQLLNDKSTQNLIRVGMNHIYNNEFSEVPAISRELQNRYPNHPVNYLLQAFRMYWQYLPIQDNKARVGEYVQTLNQCLTAVEKQYGKNSKDPEAVFFTMAARGYLALMYNYQNELMKAAGEAQKTYGTLTEGLKLTDKNPEFYFTTGMYNYYVVQYPQDHPIIKPLMFFFKSGNKPLGLKQLDIATRVGNITKVEASYFLAHIYLEHEGRPDLAVKYTSRLEDAYPNNMIFKMMHIEALLLSGRYTEAEKHLPDLRRKTEGFYPIARYLFEGILLEKRDGNDAKAEIAYKAALKIPHDEQYTREYHAMAYAGLARIADREKNRAAAREYYKKCLTKAEYITLEKEANSYLN